MANKTFPLTKGELEKIAAAFGTPFYIYDEKGIVENAARIFRAFAAFPGYAQHFAVKALPNPAVLRVLAGCGMGADCSSLAELLLADEAGIRGEKIMFSSNDTPAAEFRKAAELGAVINLDDISHIAFLEKACGIPRLISCRYNPGDKKQGNVIIGNPLEAKYGFTREQIVDGFRMLRKKGVVRFGLHTMVASNELNEDYHIGTGRLLFEFAVEIKEKTGIALEFINVGGGVGIPYRPDQEPFDYERYTAGLKRAYDEVLGPHGLGNIGIHTEWGRTVTGPYGWLVARAIHRKEIYRNYIGLDASMADLMRPAMYGAYHHITVAGKETAPQTEVYDVAGSLCENNDKFAVQRPLPPIKTGEKDGDLVIIHDAGAHGRAMGFNYNGKLRAGELLLSTDGNREGGKKTVRMIRRRETVEDYFATLRGFDGGEVAL
ncbi:MAG: diaminopimelate decarboxylase [Spirochaetaceae bacterium]|jgi:diaminopimelate decarboxylase|nr:diaminopimelate decarboxylase [Spirochaetaceae bacterium]